MEYIAKSIRLTGRVHTNFGMVSEHATQEGDIRVARFEGEVTLEIFDGAGWQPAWLPMEGLPHLPALFGTRRKDFAKGFADYYSGFFKAENPGHRAEFAPEQEQPDRHGFYIIPLSDPVGLARFREFLTELIQPA